jgi:general bacterial porin, GBP family
MAGTVPGPCFSAFRLITGVLVGKLAFVSPGIPRAVTSLVAKYLSPQIGGLRVGALCGFSNQSGGFMNNRAYRFGMSYVWGALNLGAGYLQLNSSARTPAQLNTNGAVTDTTGSSLQDVQSPTGVPLGELASSQRISGAGVNYTFGPAVAGFVYSHSKFDQFFQSGLSGTFRNFEGIFAMR